MPDTHDERGGGCVFCAIIARTAPATIVREWPDAIAFAPLGPVVPGGHILVVPRRHVADAVEDPTVTAATMARAAELAAEHEASNILTSIGRAATQSIFHLHIHVIRRAVGDQLMVPWGTTGDPQAPHSCKRSAGAEKQLAAATARAEKAEALVAEFGEPTPEYGLQYGVRDPMVLRADESDFYQRQRHSGLRVRDVYRAPWRVATDATPDGRSGPVERSETSGGQGEGSNSRAGTAGPSEACGNKYDYHVCFLPAGHDGDHRDSLNWTWMTHLGTWPNDDDTTEDSQHG